MPHHGWLLAGLGSLTLSFITTIAYAQKPGIEQKTEKKPLAAAIEAKPASHSSSATSPVDFHRLIADAQFKPIDETELQKLKTSLRLACVALDSYLNQFRALGQGWRDYLLTAQLNAQLASGGPPDLNALRDVLARFSALYQ